MKVQEMIRAILTRELAALRRQLEAYPDESTIWALTPGISNSAGTLTLHLTGNLQAFVGATLGGTDYVRDRAAEFARRDLSRTALIQEIETTLTVVDDTLSTFPDDRLSEPYPIAFGGLDVDTADFLLHLSTHLAFHVGQVDYHRRLLTDDDRSIGPVAIPGLASIRAAE